VVCAACGTANSPGVRFCGECGSAIGVDEAPAVAAAREEAQGASSGTERRRVSVLFADLVGFTTLSEVRDAEEVRDLLTRYFDLAQQIIGRYGGTVEKFIGDAVMAVWGTPTAHEDDAERAVRTALDLVDAVHQLGASLGADDLQLRAGVLTGEAAVTMGATNQGMVAGDLVNTASRLQSVAPPGSVLVGESTMHTAAGAIVFEPVGEQALKGKAAPVPAYRALRVVARRGGAGRSEQLEPPFVGRDPELRLLKDFYHGTARERGIRLVSVVGQGGIGKSRLAWEFQKYLDGISEPLFWQQGRSPAYGEGISFWALGEMVRMRAGIGEGADETMTRSRIASSVAEHVADPAERPEVEGALLQLLGISDGQSRHRDELFLAWRTFWERLSEENAVVLVFEDLQWADTGLLDFIEYMLEWSRGHRIYIVTLSRPELLDRRPTWGAGHRSFTSLGLGPLSGEDMAALLTGLVPGLPEGPLREIVARAEGVPMYAVETIRMLINAGRLVPAADDTYELNGDLGEMAIPESLHALIASRLDALTPEERSLIQDAAVLGQSFSVQALAAVHSAAGADVEPRLRRLVQRELLTFDDDPRSPERGQFAFVQSLVREVAHSTLSRADRRARHLAAARYYEAVGDDELSGVLAEHYLEAYRARPSGEEGAAVATQARIALRAASARALSVGAVDSALAYAEQALEVATDPADRLELEWEAIVSAQSAGRFDVAKRHAERGIEVADGVGNTYMRRRLVTRLGDLMTEGFIDEARAMLEIAIAEEGLTPETPGFAELASTLIKTYMRTGRDDQAVALADKALSIAEGVIPTDIRLDLIITRGTALSNLGKLTEATVTLAGARELARRLGDSTAMQRSAINLAYTTETEDTAWSYQVSREGLELARGYGNRWAERYLLGNAVEGAIETGDWEWAREQLVDVMDRELQLEEVLWYNTYSAYLGAGRGDDIDPFVRRVDQAVGEFTDAQFDYLVAGMRLEVAFCAGRLEEVCQLTDATVSIPVWGAQLASYAARAALHLGDLERARRYYQAYRARPGNLTIAQQRTMEAGVATLEGHTDDARRFYQEALGRWRDGGARWKRALCQLDIVVLGALELAERQAAAEEARSFFEEVSARPFLERLAALLPAKSVPSSQAPRPTVPVSAGPETAPERG
jgi:class 3 adenylate cyclase/tetratricopeptide (TPR) repeat protein